MKIKTLLLQPLKIPFKMSFKHASAERSATDSALVIAQTQHNTGHGESCPRCYVTNESYASVSHFFHQHKNEIVNSISDIKSLLIWMQNNHKDIDKNPAAWCSIELALLDVFSKDKKISIEKLLNLPELSDEYLYTAVLDDSSMDTLQKLAQQYNNMGFTDYKIKLSGDLDRDKAKCDVVFNKTNSSRVRLDANNLWHDPEQAVAYINKLKHDFFAIEEPLQARHYDGLVHVSKELNCKIILDESFTKIQQYECLKHDVDNWIINIRISKMGGLIRSIKIAEKAKELGIKCIVGAQVGETSILTRAALTLVNAYRDIIYAQEGGCGTHLLKHDICNPVLMFEQGGKITTNKIRQLQPHGLGLSIDI